MSWSRALSWISIVTDRRAETFEERELRSALFCLFQNQHSNRCITPFIATSDGTRWRKGDILLAFVGVTHFWYFQVSLDLEGCLFEIMQSAPRLGELSLKWGGVAKSLGNRSRRQPSGRSDHMIVDLHYVEITTLHLYYLWEAELNSLTLFRSQIYIPVLCIARRVRSTHSRMIYNTGPLCTQLRVSWWADSDSSWSRGKWSCNWISCWYLRPSLEWV